MSTHKRLKKSGVCYLAVVTTKTGKQYSKTFARKVDAEMWEREQKQLLHTDPQKIATMQRSSTKLIEFCDIWLKKYAETHKTASSVKRDRMIIKHQIHPYWGEIKLGDVKQELVEDWINKLKTSKLSPKSCNHCLNLLKKLLNDAVAWRYVLSNEAKHVQALKLQKTEANFWTKDESKQFLTYIKERLSQHFCVFSLALYTGLRKGEIHGLKWDCVDLERRVLVVKRIYCEVQKEFVERTKGKKDRWVPIHESLLQVLIEEKSKSSSDFVIPDFDWIHSHRLMAKFCKAAGVSLIRFHDIRHTFASNLVMSGKPLYEVQKLLGHASFATTQQYAHLAPDYLQRATDVLDFDPVEKGLSNVVRLRRDGVA